MASQPEHGHIQSVMNTGSCSDLSSGDRSPRRNTAEVSKLPATTGGEKNPGRMNSEKVGEIKRDFTPRMANRENASSGRKNDVENSRNVNRTYKKECTLAIEVESIEKFDVIKILITVEQICGKGSILACVPTTFNKFELTMCEVAQCEKLLPSFRIGETRVFAKSAFEKATIVSLMHLPPLLPDSEIEGKLSSYGCKIKSPIWRKYYHGLETKIEDGTRYMKVQFPHNRNSLPYALKFSRDGEAKHFKVIHTGQEAVCNNCLSPDHIARYCPDNECYKCFDLGHISLDCPLRKCRDCGNTKKQCSCQQTPTVNPNMMTAAEVLKHIKTNIANNKPTHNAQKTIVEEQKNENEPQQADRVEDNEKRGNDPEKNVTQPTNETDNQTTTDVTEPLPTNETEQRTLNAASETEETPMDGVESLRKRKLEDTSGQEEHTKSSKCQIEELEESEEEDKAECNEENNNTNLNNDSNDISDTEQTCDDSLDLSENTKEKDHRPTFPNANQRRKTIVVEPNYKAAEEKRAQKKKKGKAKK